MTAPPDELDRFASRVRSVEELVALIGAPSEFSLRKERTSLDESMRQFIARSPFALIGTHSADGRCDVSPRGDAPGFVQAIGDRCLLIPDRPGNRRTDSLRNIIESGRVGVLFLIPGVGETLRVNGRAAIIRDQPWLEALAAHGKRPALAVAVSVEECFLQCAKALVRSSLWDAEKWPDLQGLPCAAEMFDAHVNMPEFNAAKIQVLLYEAYKNKLY